VIKDLIRLDASSASGSSVIFDDIKIHRLSASIDLRENTGGISLIGSKNFASLANFSGFYLAGQMTRGCF
jgi:hypothetical protein